jgi:enediyne biosynthesis protein E4
LLALVVLEVLAQVPGTIGLVLAGLADAGTGATLLMAIDDSVWISALVAVGLLMLMVLVAAGLVRRHRAGDLLGWIALAGAVAAQAFLVGGSVTLVAQSAQSGADVGGPMPAPFPDLLALNGAVGVLVFLLTISAYVVLGSRSTTHAKGPIVPAAGLKGARVLSVTMGVAATLIVLTGSVASATRSSSAVACVDVTTDVGIRSRGGVGNAVVDGSDTSVAMQQNMGNGAAVGDYNQDGNLDIYLLGQPGDPNRLYRNDHTPSHEGFTDVTDAAGLGGFSGSRAAQFVDLNDDGRLDLVVVDDYMPGTALQPSRIYQNVGEGRFQDVTAGSGFNPVGLIVGGLGIADYNRDGLPDIYITYWTGGMEMGATYDAHNLLFENLGDFRFRDVTNEVGLGGLSTGSYTPVFADLNGDGWPDLYLAIDAKPEMLFINDRGHFTDKTTESGLGTVRNGMGAALVDLEGAGVPSLYVTNITEPNGLLGTAPGGDALLRSRLNPGGAITYVDEAAAAGVRDAGWGWGATFSDLNLDGYPDLFVAQGMHVVTREVSAALTNDHAHVFVGTGIGTFTQATNNGCDIPGDQRAVVAFDYNRDGKPDLLVSQVGYPDTLLENRSELVGHWLTVVAEPTAGQTVVGAKVTVTAGGRRWVQTLIGGGSYLAGPPDEAYFGLGSADRVTTVAVDWPDGTTTTRSDLAVDELLRMSPP